MTPDFLMYVAFAAFATLASAVAIDGWQSRKMWRDADRLVARHMARRL